METLVSKPFHKPHAPLKKVRTIPVNVPMAYILVRFHFLGVAATRLRVQTVQDDYPLYVFLVYQVSHLRFFVGLDQDAKRCGAQ